ncbi:MAG: sugar ABC transporter ATP-binding protein [Ferruginibacter sp.]
MQLQIQDITKYFPGVKAIDGISLTIRAGEVHAICGENGAGKSTLLNIITGNLQPDKGSLLIDGKQVIFSSPRQAFANGIAIVYQHLSLVDSLSIAENIFASFPAVDQYGFLKRSLLLKNTNDLLHKLDLGYLQAGTLVHTLSAGQKQMVEIAKSLAGNPSVVFLDEPTAAISEKDVQILFKIIKQLKQQGVAIVYISHRLREIFEIADIITVLKDGRSQGSFKATGVDSNQLIRLMVGREINQEVTLQRKQTAPLLTITNFRGKGFTNINFTIHKGEILGMAGLIGAGRTEIAKAIFGSIPVEEGSMEIRKKHVRPFKHPVHAIRQGIGYVTEDRKSQGMFSEKTIAENIYVTELALKREVQPQALNKMAVDWCKSLNIKTPTIQKKVVELSGGNQQKVLLARWLHGNPDILILDEPTHGIDVGAKFEIYQLIRQLASEGKGILLISSEMSELLNLCQRIMVIREGRIVALLDAAEATEEKILSLAMKQSGEQISPIIK